MNENKRRSGLLWILIAVISVAANGFFIYHNYGVHDSTEQVKSDSLPAEQIYTCPMDPQIRQNHPGDCPICGMFLELVVSGSPRPATSDSEPAQAVPDPNSAVKYQCPMHPQIIRDHPGDCPICGMKLVKMKNAAQVIGHSGDDGNVSNRAEVQIDLTRQQLIGLRTAFVERSDVRSDWHTVGRVQIDQTKVTKTNVKSAGYVEQIFIDFVGRPVRSGEPLFTFYSPDVLSAQREYLLAFKSGSSGGDATNDSLIIAGARQKLLLWDVSPEQIDRLEQSGEVTKALSVVSPVSGVVTAKNIVAGSFMNPGDTPYEITDLSSVWVIADAYQSDAGRVRVGMSATVSVESLPDRPFNGTVAFVDPTLDPESRTFKVRINVANAGGDLKPDMFADVLLQSRTHLVLTVPADAIIPSGSGSMVFVAVGDGRFQPRSVTLGAKSGERIEVMSGLSEGESVVTRANFLVDSESSLRAALAAFGGK